MKKPKLLIAFIALFVSLTMNAQTQLEKKAHKAADEMTKVLSLNEQDSNSVYEIQLNRFKENQSIKKEFSDQPDIKKEKLNNLGKTVYNQLKKALGKERLAKWRNYKSNK
jgi:hypothetical protein